MLCCQLLQTNFYFFLGGGRHVKRRSSQLHLAAVLSALCNYFFICREAILAKHKYCHSSLENGVEGETCGLAGIFGESLMSHLCRVVEVFHYYQPTLANDSPPSFSLSLVFNEGGQQPYGALHSLQAKILQTNY